MPTRGPERAPPQPTPSTGPTARGQAGGGPGMLLSCPAQEPLDLSEGCTAGPPGRPLPPCRHSKSLLGCLPGKEGEKEKEKKRRGNRGKPKAGKNAFCLRFGKEGRAWGRPSLPRGGHQCHPPTHPSLTTWGAKLSQAQHKDKIEMQIPSHCSE